MGRLRYSIQLPPTWELTPPPRDMALAGAGRLLYVQTAGGQKVAGFRVSGNGSRTRIDTAGGLPFEAQGITAR
jgi:hypothetical protein